MGLTLNRGVTADRSRVNRDTLQQDLSLASSPGPFSPEKSLGTRLDLSLDCDDDLHVVLAFAE